MKNIVALFYLIIVLLLSDCTKKKTSYPLRYISTNVKHRINDIFFINQTKGFAVGGTLYKGGCILKTEDGGVSWQKISDNNILGINDKELQTLFAIDFLDENIGQIVGFGGRVLRTEDGGNTWLIIINGTYEAFHSIAMLAEQKTLISTYSAFTDGSIFSSETIWYNFAKDTFNFPIRDLFFLDKNIGFAAAYGTIQKTTDGGKSWQQTPIKGDYYYDIDFPTENIGYACGWDGGIYKTSNQGKSWQTLDAKNKAFSARQHYENIDFITESKGAVCGYRGEVLFTENGGKTWQVIKTETKDNFHSLKFLNENKLYVGGENGVLLEISVP
ncbi:MAG: WD40/YVTN/BNR-like repeat-containing protein [Chitinophagales bacterium]